MPRNIRTGSKCCVCHIKKNSTATRREIFFFEIPTEKDLRHTWVHSIQNLLHNPSFIPKKRDWVCTKHFDKNCFLHENNHIQLKPGSLPRLLSELEHQKNEQELSAREKENQLKNGMDFGVSLTSQKQTDSSLEPNTIVSTIVKPKEDAGLWLEIHSMQKRLDSENCSVLLSPVSSQSRESFSTDIDGSDLSFKSRVSESSSKYEVVQVDGQMIFSFASSEDLQEYVKSQENHSPESLNKETPVLKPDKWLSSVEPSSIITAELAIFAVSALKLESSPPPLIRLPKFVARAREYDSPTKQDDPPDLGIIEHCHRDMSDVSNQGDSKSDYEIRRKSLPTRETTVVDKKKDACKGDQEINVAVACMPQRTENPALLVSLSVEEARTHKDSIENFGKKQTTSTASPMSLEYSRSSPGSSVPGENFTLQDVGNHKCINKSNSKPDSSGNSSSAVSKTGGSISRNVAKKHTHPIMRTAHLKNRQLTAAVVKSRASNESEAPVSHAHPDEGGFAKGAVPEAQPAGSAVNDGLLITKTTNQTAVAEVERNIIKDSLTHTIVKGSDSSRSSCHQERFEEETPKNERASKVDVEGKVQKPSTCKVVVQSTIQPNSDEKQEKSIQDREEASKSGIGRSVKPSEGLKGPSINTSNGSSQLSKPQDGKPNEATTSKARAISKMRQICQDPAFNVHEFVKEEMKRSKEETIDLTIKLTKTFQLIAWARFHRIYHAGKFHVRFFSRTSLPVILVMPRDRIVAPDISCDIRDLSDEAQVPSIVKHLLNPNILPTETSLYAVLFCDGTKWELVGSINYKQSPIKLPPVQPQHPRDTGCRLVRNKLSLSKNRKQITPSDGPAVQSSQETRLASHYQETTIQESLEAQKLLATSDKFAVQSSPEIPCKKPASAAAVEKSSAPLITVNPAIGEGPATAQDGTSGKSSVSSVPTVAYDSRRASREVSQLQNPVESAPPKSSAPLTTASLATAECPATVRDSKLGKCSSSIVRTVTETTLVTEGDVKIKAEIYEFQEVEEDIEELYYSDDFYSSDDSDYLDSSDFSKKDNREERRTGTAKGLSYKNDSDIEECFEDLDEEMLRKREKELEAQLAKIRSELNSKQQRSMTAVRKLVESNQPLIKSLSNPSVDVPVARRSVSPKNTSKEMASSISPPPAEPPAKKTRTSCDSLSSECTSSSTSKTVRADGSRFSSSSETFAAQTMQTNESEPGKLCHLTVPKLSPCPLRTSSSGKAAPVAINRNQQGKNQSRQVNSAPVSKQTPAPLPKLTSLSNVTVNLANSRKNEADRVCRPSSLPLFINPQPEVSTLTVLMVPHLSKHFNPLFPNDAPTARAPQSTSAAGNVNKCSIQAPQTGNRMEHGKLILAKPLNPTSQMVTPSGSTPKTPTPMVLKDNPPALLLHGNKIVAKPIVFPKILSISTPIVKRKDESTVGFNFDIEFAALPGEHAALCPLRTTITLPLQEESNRWCMVAVDPPTRTGVILPMLKNVLVSRSLIDVVLSAAAKHKLLCYVPLNFEGLQDKSAFRNRFGVYAAPQLPRHVFLGPFSRDAIPDDTSLPVHMKVISVNCDPGIVIEAQKKKKMEELKAQLRPFNINPNLVIEPVPTNNKSTTSGIQTVINYRKKPREDVEVVAIVNSNPKRVCR